MQHGNSGGSTAESGLNELRCDGCGSIAPATTAHKNDSSEHIAEYCPGCEDTRIVEGTDPGDHEQYRLREL